VHEGVLRDKTPKIQLDRQLAVELRQLADLQSRYALLKQEHELLKKAIRFCSEARRTPSPSSTLRVASSR
jgi:transposase